MKRKHLTNIAFPALFVAAAVQAAVAAAPRPSIDPGPLRKIDEAARGGPGAAGGASPRLTS